RSEPPPAPSPGSRPVCNLGSRRLSANAAESGNEFPCRLRPRSKRLAKLPGPLREQHRDDKRPWSCTPPQGWSWHLSAQQAVHGRDGPALDEMRSAWQGASVSRKASRLESSLDGHYSPQCRGNAFSLGRDRESSSVARPRRRHL